MLSMTSRCGDATEAMIVLGARIGGLIATSAGVAVACHSPRIPFSRTTEDGSDVRTPHAHSGDDSEAVRIDS